MSQIEIIQIIEQIKQEITIDSNGHGKATIRATARLADVQDSSLRRALLSAALEPSALAQSLIQQGFSPAALETWNKGIPDMGVAAVIEYYALAELTGGRLNPYMEQQFKDYAGNLLAEHNRKLLTPSEERWLGVVNFAESELGKKVPLSGAHYRGHLGTWVRTFYPHLGDRQETRLVNGVQQPIYVLDELQDWEFVEEIDDGNSTYWVLTPKGVLLQAEL